MRVLHLIDGVSPQAHPMTLAMIADAQGRLGHIEQEVYLLGGQSLADAGRAAGIKDARCVGVPLGRAVLGWPSLRRAMGQAGERPFDLVHCWSVGAAVLASLMFRDRPRLLTMTTLPTRQAVRWVRALAGRDPAPLPSREGLGRGRAANGPSGVDAPTDALFSPVLTGAAVAGSAHPTLTILPISSTIRRELIRGGVAPQAAHVLRPAIDMARIDRSARAALRSQWKIDSEKMLVIALLGDPPAANDAVAGMCIARFALETLVTEGRDVRLVLHPKQRRRLQAKRMLRSFAGLRLLIDEPRIAEPWSILPGCDMALALSTQGPVQVAGHEALAVSSQRPAAPDIGRGYLGAGGSAEAGGGGLALLWAMAANLPIVGEATYAISEIVEDRHSALLARPGDFKALAHRVRQAAIDSHLAWQLRDTARHECYSFFSRQRYCESLRQVYGQLSAGGPVSVPELEVTGGLKFSGRL